MITQEYLLEHPNHVLVFSDDLKRKTKLGYGALRNEPNTLGFTVYKETPFSTEDLFSVTEIAEYFWQELSNLMYTIYTNPEKVFLISELGKHKIPNSGTYDIWDGIIKKNLEYYLPVFPNVQILWE